MKRFLTLAILLLAAGLTSRAQEEIVKTGLNFGPLPAIGYSSDLGLHYGALVDIYQYGDGSVYPDYKWKINVETSWYSKGNSIYHIYFDSKYLIPGIRVSADLTYLGNKTTNFYGFNGAASLYVPGLNKITENGQKYNELRIYKFHLSHNFYILQFYNLMHFSDYYLFYSLDFEEFYYLIALIRFHREQIGI